MNRGEGDELFCSKEPDSPDERRLGRIRPDHPEPGDGQCLYPGGRRPSDLSKTIGQGIRQEKDHYVIQFRPEDTQLLSCGRYVYEVKLVRRNDYTDTIIPARDFFLERSVTSYGT